jgi:hypothetical protein
MNLLVMDYMEALRNKLREDMNSYADDLSTGQCTSFEAYKELCGVIRGLAIAERHLLDLAQNSEDEYDE